MTAAPVRHALSRSIEARAVSGLYAVTPDLADTARLVALVDAALSGGARVVQYRNKTVDPGLRVRQAERLAAICRRHGRPFIVNDHADVALAIDGAGLHVGADDYDGGDSLEALRALRRRLGDDRLLGVSCYRSVVLAGDAVAAGADYVAFGSVFPSSTKPAAPPAALETFGAARGLGVPLVGIGGITPENLPSLVAAGADAAAVIGALFGAGEPAAVAAQAERLAAAFARCTPDATSLTTSPSTRRP